jgi:transcriptional antiterminator RfaH
MDWSDDSEWFAIRIKRFREKNAAAMLAELGFEVFLPLVKVEPAGWAVIRFNFKPLFPGYCFARFSPASSLGLVEHAPGVLNVIKSGGRPIPVADEIIREIQDQVEADGLIRLQPRELKPGDRVSILEGPFAGVPGRVLAEMDDHKRVAILAEALWNARVVIEKRWLEAEVV